MELKAGYKRTEVGVIPEDWDVSTVGREFEIKLGKMLDSAKNVGVLKPYLGNRRVQWNQIDINDLETMPMSRADLGRFRLRHGDLLVCEGGEVGRAAIWEAPIDECYYQKALHRLRPLRGFNSQFMVALLQYWSDHGLLSNYVTQTSIAHLTRERLAEVPLPMPRPQEQSAITAALSDVDNLVASLDKLVAKKRDIKQATMQRLLTGKRRLPGFSKNTGYKQTEVGVIPEDWGVEKLGHCLISSPDYGINAPAVPFTDKLPVYLRITDITEDGRFSPEKLVSVEGADTERYFLKDGDLVFARTGASVGKSYLYDPGDGRLVFAGFLIRVKPNPTKLVPAFLASYVTTGRYWSWVNVMSMRSGQPGINGNEYALLHIPLPATEEQRAIATVLSDMDAEIASLEARRDKTKLLKQGMMQELLTGRIRLV